MGRPATDAAVTGSAPQYAITTPLATRGTRSGSFSRDSLQQITGSDRRDFEVGVQ